MIANKSLSYIKRGCILLGILLASYILFICGLSLHKTENRPQAAYLLPEDDKQELFATIASTSDESEIIKHCSKFACRKLSFHRKNKLNLGEANCIGYAQYTSSLLNTAFKHKGLSSKARPVVGQVHLYDFNLHPLAMTIMPNNLKSFFKDHDFVEIIKENGKTIYIDTSLQDIIGKSFI